MITNTANCCSIKPAATATYANMKSLVSDFISLLFGFGAATFNWIHGSYTLQVFHDPEAWDKVITGFAVGLAGGAGGYLGKKVLSYTWIILKTLLTKTFKRGRG